mmetsp:Transcript_9589/g.28036  ORF Transcript_9589/g.28036 Transcript_9589/m.28036 type:complete len:191 (-) Transcript_9589:325-897(-)
MVDYSKFDHVGSSDEEGAADNQRAAAEAAKQAAMRAPPVDESRSEIERMKAEKRAQREAREKAEAAAGGKPADETVAVASADQEPQPPAESEPLMLLRQAEGIQASMKAAMATIEACLAQSESVELTAVSSLNGLLGKLQGIIDSVSVGDLEEGAERDGARARRKALNAFAENVMDELAALRKKVIAANK